MLAENTKIKPVIYHPPYIPCIQILTKPILSPFSLLRVHLQL